MQDKLRERRRVALTGEVCAELAADLGRPVRASDLLDLSASDRLSERWGRHQNAIMGGTPTELFNVRVVAPRWTDVEALLPLAAAVFAGDERAVLLHQETSSVGGLIVAVDDVLAHAQTLAEPEVGPGIALASLDGCRGMELDAAGHGFPGWTLLWWRED